MTSIFIVILNFNGKDNTIACLESVAGLQTTDYRLQTVVVDNGSKERLMMNDEGLMMKECKVIRNGENLGYAGGNNVGIRFALEQGADYIVILNNDTLVDKTLVNGLLDIAMRDRNIGIIAPKIYFAKGFEFHKDRYTKDELGRVIWYAGGITDWSNVLGHHRGVDEVDHGQYDKMEETDFASGCCFMVRRDVFEKVGFLDEKYFLYYEDSDFCERTKRSGYKILYAPKAFLWHKNAGSAGGSGSSLQDYYISRNRMLFAMRYAPFRSKVAVLKESFGLMMKGRFWQQQGVRDFYFRRFGRGSYDI